jgi:hypothetical protein
MILTGPVWSVPYKFNRCRRRKIQTGLSQKIGGKLKAMKAERNGLNLTSSGRDLMPLKTSRRGLSGVPLLMGFRANPIDSMKIERNLELVDRKGRTGQVDLSTDICRLS